MPPLYQPAAPDPPAPSTSASFTGSLLRARKPSPSTNALRQTRLHQGLLHIGRGRGPRLRDLARAQATPQEGSPETWPPTPDSLRPIESRSKAPGPPHDRPIAGTRKLRPRPGVRGRGGGGPAHPPGHLTAGCLISRERTATLRSVFLSQRSPIIRQSLLVRRGVAVGR